MKHPLPESAFKGHIAVVGMTGGGKTFTTKGIVEHILAVDPSARVCVLDPIKSDWWGITSSASGKRPGLPFQILGGPRGHVPLHDSTGKAIGELVGSGALPLSIIDMADFGPGGLQAFFNDFAPALLRKVRGVVHLVLEEAHEFAPKERAGFGGETMTVHFAKKLATAGRSKGIRIIAATQRTQQLHNSVLGSCQTVIAHQLTYPADIEPVEKWFKGHVDKATFSRFSETLTSLPTGTGWMCSGQAKVAEMVQFPRISTFDNSATPDGAAEIAVTTAPVDREKLRQIMGEAAKEAEANDPATLKKRIRELEAEVAKKPAAAVDQVAIEAARIEGREAAIDDIGAKVQARLEELNIAAGGIAGIARAISSDIQRARYGKPRTAPKLTSTSPASITAPPAVQRAVLRDSGRAQERAAMRMSSADGSLHSAARAILTVLVQRHPAVWTWTQAATLAGLKARGGHFNAGRQELRSRLLIEERGDTISATDAGIAVIGEATKMPTGAALIEFWCSKLSSPAPEMLRHIAQHGPVRRDDLATALGKQARGGHWNGGLSQLRSNNLVEEGPGGLALAPTIFEER